MITNTAVKMNCRVNSPSATPRSAKNAISAGGNTASMSLEAAIASRTGRST